MDAIEYLTSLQIASLLNHASKEEIDDLLRRNFLLANGEFDAAELNATKNIYYRMFKDAYPSWGEAECHSAYLDFAKILQNVVKEMPSFYEDVAFYEILLRLQGKIEKAMKEQGINLPNMPLIGTLFTSQVNAMAIKVPSVEDYIILFEREIFIFFNLVSKIVARIIPFENPIDGKEMVILTQQNVEKNIYENPLMAIRFKELLEAFVIKNTISSAPHYFLVDEKYPVKYQAYSFQITSAMELFVLSHEYGHVFHGHLDANMRKSRLLADREVEFITNSWLQEYEADLFGANALLYIMENEQEGLGLEFNHACIDIFFSVLDIVERCVMSWKLDIMTKSDILIHTRQQL